MAPTFAELGVPPDLIAVLEQAGIVDPSPIQVEAIPPALAGRDVTARAPTGSGKTLAFGVPLMAGVGRGAPTSPGGLVLAPTRELADQIRRDLIPLGRVAKRYVGIVYGGVPYDDQIRSLRKGIDVLVATPGRLLDLVDQGHADLGSIEIAVIDEADRLADMGFLPDVRRIMDLTPNSRRTWLFSATLDGDVAVLTRRFQRDPVRCSVARDTDTPAARHHFWKATREGRLDLAVLAITHRSPALVFCRTRKDVDRTTAGLRRAGIDAEPIHGGLSQGRRHRSLREFSRGRIDALVATDVAARGIHVDEVALVLHFDPPEDAKDYLHRSGRTARAGAGGVVLSLVPDDRQAAYRNLARALGLRADATRPDPSSLDTGGEELAPNVRPRPSTTPVPRRRGRGGKKAQRSNKPRPRYWD